MRAAVLTSLGSPPAPAERPDPSASAGRTLVRVTAAPVVPLDVLAASGTSYFGRPATPFVPGVQGVGVVAGSATHPVGERVWFATTAGMAPGDGSMAELCSVPDADVVPVRAALGDVELAALGLSGVAAWGCLVRRGGLVAGERVVVLGGGGAVGQAGIGIARSRAADRVVAVCRSEASAQRARQAGADEVVTCAADPDPDELGARIATAAGGPVDVVLDPVFGPVAVAALAALGEGGRLVNLGGSAGDAATFSSVGLRSRSLSVLGYTNTSLSAAERAEVLGAVTALAAEGWVRVAHRARPLEDVAEVWETTAAGRAAPRLVLTP